MGVGVGIGQGTVDLVLSRVSVSKTMGGVYV